MSPKPKQSKPAEVTELVAGIEVIAIPGGGAERDEKIRFRAYELYIERGQQPGYEIDDWLQAEREIEERQL